MNNANRRYVGMHMFAMKGQFIIESGIVADTPCYSSFNRIVNGRQPLQPTHYCRVHIVFFINSCTMCSICEWTLIGCQSRLANLLVSNFCSAIQIKLSLNMTCLFIHVPRRRQSAFGWKRWRRYVMYCICIVAARDGPACHRDIRDYLYIIYTYIWTMGVATNAIVIFII